MKKIIAAILCLTLCLSMFAGCTKNDEKTITIAASATPHAEILQVAKEELAKKGYTLEITVYNDYVVPNQVVEDGEVDANYFQHQPYLTTFNAEKGTHLVSVAAIHYEPFAIYPGTKNTLELADGDKVAIPNDGSNRARALLLLQAQGLIKLKDGAGVEATKLDIVENKWNLDIVEMEAGQISRVRDDVALAVINGNYALQAGLNASKDAIAVEENNEQALTYANILVVKEGNEKNEKILALIEALESQAVKDFIENTYHGAVVGLT